MAQAWMVERIGSDPDFYWDRTKAEQCFLAACRVDSWEEFWNDDYLSRFTEGSLAGLGYLLVDDGPRLILIEIKD